VARRQSLTHVPWPQKVENLHRFPQRRVARRVVTVVGHPGSLQQQILQLTRNEELEHWTSVRTHAARSSTGDIPDAPSGGQQRERQASASVSQAQKTSLELSARLSASLHQPDTPRRHSSFSSSMRLDHTAFVGNNQRNAAENSNTTPLRESAPPATAEAASGMRQEGCHT